jgi:hypothetical protein
MDNPSHLHEWKILSVCLVAGSCEDVSPIGCIKEIVGSIPGKTACLLTFQAGCTRWPSAKFKKAWIDTPAVQRVFMVWSLTG